MSRYALVLLFPLVSIAAWAEDATIPPADSDPKDKAITYCAPFYPSAAFESRRTGETHVSFTVTKDGSPMGTKVAKTSGDDALDVAALSCVSSSRYLPATKSGVTTEARWTRTVDWFPPRAHRCSAYLPKSVANPTGATRLSMQIGTDGGVSRIAVAQSSGNGDLDRAAMECARPWHYKPALQNGIPVAVSWLADVYWGNGPLRFGDQVDRCLRANPPTADQLTGVDGVTSVSFVLVDGFIVDLTLARSSGSRTLDDAALRCTASFLAVETVYGTDLDAFKITEKFDWRAAGAAVAGKT
jgi:TonB family protein